jgi:ABC-2 type transport system permease protein
MGSYYRRGARHWVVTAVTTALLFLSIAFLYDRAAQAVMTLDMTQANQFTLSAETLAVLEELDRPVRVTGFYSAASLRLRELDALIVRLYESATDGLITSDYINPDENPALAQQFQVQVDGELFVSYLTPDGAVDFDTLTRVVPENNQERNITSAIVRLLEINRFTVAFDSTFSDITPFDTTARGFSGIFNGLAANGINTTSLNLAGLAAEDGDIPAEITTIVLTRMNQQLPPEAIGVLDRFLDRGGSLLIMADAELGDAPFLSEADPFNDYLWENFGIRMLDAVAIDALSNAGTELDLLSYATSDGSSITARLNQENPDNPADNSSRTLFRVARAVAIDPSPPVTNGMVIATSEVSYGETGLEALLGSNAYEFSRTEDVVGPLNVAAWAHDQTTGGRILLVGDTDWATNGLVRNPVGNGVLFTDGIAWLTGFGERLVFAPQARTSNLPTIFLSAQDLDTIALVTTVLMPAGALLLGFAVYWARSRR